MRKVNRMSLIKDLKQKKCKGNIKECKKGFALCTKTKGQTHISLYREIVALFCCPFLGAIFIFEIIGVVLLWKELEILNRE